MGNKPFINDLMRAGRIVRHGKINSLADGFNLNGTLFTIFIQPKAEDDGCVILNARLASDDVMSPMPFLTGDWNPTLIAELGPDNGILNDYDVYFGTGTDHLNR